MMNFRRTALATFLALLICASLISAPVRGQQADPPIKVEKTLVNVPVIVSDHQGRYISGLKAGDFKLYQDQAEQPIVSFDATGEPLNVALIIDTSGSTQPVLDDIKSAGMKFLKELRPSDRAMIVSVDYDVHVLSPLTSERKALENAVKRAKTGEQFGTVLRDAIAEVIERSFKRIDGRKAIIVLTDGKDVGSRIPQQVLLDLAAGSGAMIYTVFESDFLRRRGVIDPLTFPRPPPRPRPSEQRRQLEESRNPEAVRFLWTLADVSAGRFYGSDASDFKKTFNLIAEELRHQYRLGFYPDPTKADGQRHTLRVEVTAPDAVVRARRSYQAASPTNGS